MREAAKERNWATALDFALFHSLEFLFDLAIAILVYSMSSIKDERLRQNMSQKRLALEAGINVRTLRKIEKGEYVSPESMRSVLSVLRVEAAGASDAIEPLKVVSGAEAMKLQIMLVSMLLFLVSCFLANLALSAFAPAVAHTAPIIGLIGLAIATIVFDRHGLTWS